MATIVVSVSETMLFGPKLELTETVLESTWARFVYFGLHRFNHLFRPKEDTGWRWSVDQKRWRFLILERRRLVASPSFETETTAMANSYFAGRGPAVAEELRSLLKLEQSD